jgi:E3 ubiquitin-protein ligase HUWE1
MLMRVLCPSRRLTFPFPSHREPLRTKFGKCLTAVRDRGNIMNVATIMLPIIVIVGVLCKDMTIKDGRFLKTTSNQLALANSVPDSHREAR